MFPFKIVLAILNPLYFHIHFRIHLSILQKRQLGFYRNYTESLGELREYLNMGFSFFRSSKFLFFILLNMSVSALQNVIIYGVSLFHCYLIQLIKIFLFLKRETLMSESWIGCLQQAPHQKSSSQPGHVPWLGTELAAFHCTRQGSTKPH